MEPMLNANTSQLALVYYPSGGYGFYLTRLINLAIKDIVHTNDLLSFDELGTSHSCPTVVPSISSLNYKEKFLFIKPEYQNQVASGLPIVLPVCPGSNENLQILKSFPNATIIKIIYNDTTWPLVFYNCVHKARPNGSIEDQIKFDQYAFGEDTMCARRENYKLFLQNSALRNSWKEPDCITVDVEDLIIDPVKALSNIACSLDSTVQNLDLVYATHNKFLQSNPAINTWLKIKHIIDNINVPCDLTSITDLYWQAVFDFYIQEKFQIEIPVNDYSNWFTNTNEVVKMLHNQGILNSTCV